MVSEIAALRAIKGLPLTQTYNARTRLMEDLPGVVRESEAVAVIENSLAVSNQEAKDAVTKLISIGALTPTRIQRFVDKQVLAGYEAFGRAFTIEEKTFLENAAPADVARNYSDLFYDDALIQSVTGVKRGSLTREAYVKKLSAENVEKYFRSITGAPRVRFFFGAFYAKGYTRRPAVNAWIEFATRGSITTPPNIKPATFTPINRTERTLFFEAALEIHVIWEKTLIAIASYDPDKRNIEAHLEAYANILELTDAGDAGVELLRAYTEGLGYSPNLLTTEIGLQRRGDFIVVDNEKEKETTLEYEIFDYGKGYSSTLKTKFRVEEKTKGKWWEHATENADAVRASADRLIIQGSYAKTGRPKGSQFTLGGP